jgi:hypothetical protein
MVMMLLLLPRVPTHTPGETATTHATKLETATTTYTKKQRAGRYR